MVGIVLGAGSSSRLRRPKQTLPLGDTTLLGWVMRDVEASSLHRVVLVVGGAAQEAIDGLKLRRAYVVHNDAYGTGCASSLLAGLDAAGACDSIMLLLGDMPGVDADVIETVRDAFERERPWGAVTRYQNGLGHPFVFAADAFPALRALQGDKAVWKLVERHPQRVRRLTVDRPLPRDVDTWEDYHAVIAARRFRSMPTSALPVKPFSSIFVCDRNGDLLRLQRANGAWVGEHVLEDAGAQCVAISERRVLVGTRERGVLFSANCGASWEQADLPEPSVFSVAISDADGALYAGTEPSRLFVSRDGGRWSELEALQRIPSRDRWSFPPRPWTHHVRWIAPDPRHRERLLVGIELGGLMYSDDGGETFSDHRPGAKRDVHSLFWHPRLQGRVYQAAGDGAAWSRDGGLTWEAVDAGRDLPYCWALAVDPSDPESWYVSAASGPGAAHNGADARGRLYRWSGHSWEQLVLPDDTMPYALAASDVELIAAMADGRIIHSGDRGQSWTDTGVQAGSVVALAAD